MTLPTITKGILSVGAALPDPPFEFQDGATLQGFDVELTKAIASELGLEWRLVPYQGGDFNGIFAGLSSGAYDCVASGTTITPERQAMASFCTPYLKSGQSLVCNIERTPQVRSIDDLADLVIGVQQGNTSAPVAQRLKTQGRVADVRIYPYHDIELMLGDLDAGKIGAVMKLAPVMHWFVRERPSLRVVQVGITEELLGVCVRLNDEALRDPIDGAQERLRARGLLDRLSRKWLES